MRKQMYIKASILYVKIRAYFSTLCTNPPYFNDIRLALYQN